MYRLRVPATTANLGPGFDTIGMALSLYNFFDFFESEEEKDFEDDNMIYLAAKIIYDSLDKDISKFRFKVEGDVPRSRGLGSSATCIIGGLLGANYLLGQPYSNDEILAFATRMEGHPDNVAPALLGSCIFSFMEEGKVHYHRLNGLESIQCFVAIPDFVVETSLARAALPEHLSYEEAVHNISRMPFLVEGLRTSNLDMILLGTKDKLHEPYRKKLIDGYETMRNIEDAFKGRLLISGAGPTLLFLTDSRYSQENIKESWEELAKKTGHQWEILPLNIDEKGALLIQ